MGKQKIFLAADHAGFELKEEIKNYLDNKGFDVEDKGAFKFDADDDYPDFIFKTAKKVAENPNSLGIIFGASGQGEAIVANKAKGIRAAVYNTNNLDIAKLSKIHNNANILSIGARFVAKESAIKAVNAWLGTNFSSEARHKRRIKKIENIEKKLYK